MGFQDYIGEQEACTFAGVSASTLRRFAEAGYFQIETDSDGLRLFSKSELENLFGLKPLTSSRQKAASSNLTVEKTVTSSSASFYSSPAASPAPQVDQNVQPATERIAATVVRAPVLEPIAAARTPPIAPEIAPRPPYHSDPTPLEARPSSGIAIEALEREITKLQNIVALQEKLLDIREEEIKSIKGERDWLRSRVEKLEEKNERDQLLLLAETQTVRQLINLQQQKKRSSVQLALEWLGFKSPVAAPGQPIDISPAPSTPPTAQG